MCNKTKVDYKSYINSKEWKEKKEKLFELKGRECEQCGYKHRLHVHHLTYERLGNEKMEDLQILCFQCHMSKHDEYFDKLILKNRPKPKNWVELKPGEIRLTMDRLEALRTSKGGLTKHVYKMFGYKKLPKKKGWFKGMLNQPINEDLYNKTLDEVKRWDSERGAERATKKDISKHRKLRFDLCNDLRKKGIRTINGESISYMTIDMLKKLHKVYC